jgi:NAD(P)-dependent dehydrogenase (short-subunit alcohol dehydrogenase family)
MAPADQARRIPGWDLTGRRMVITGAARGLGRALAIVAADHGAQPVLLGRSGEALEQVAASIQLRTGTHCEVFACDLAQPLSVQAACQAVLAASPVVDILVNNGAPWLPGCLEDLDDGDIAATIAAAVTGTVLITKGLLAGLRRSHAADVVTVVSTAALAGDAVSAASAAFAAAKHGQAGFSERLGAELRAQGIRVAAIYPPDFDDTDPLTTRWQETRDPASGARLTNREVSAAILFAICAPRVCAYPTIVIQNMSAT